MLCMVGYRQVSKDGKKLLHVLSHLHIASELVDRSLVLRGNHAVCIVHAAHVLGDTVSVQCELLTQYVCGSQLQANVDS